MEIIRTIVHLAKFEPSNDKWQNPLKGREGQSFKLLPKHFKHKYVFEIGLNIYLTNLDTDFMLDMDVNILQQFDTSNKIPTPKELYELYCAGHIEGNKKIEERAKKEGILIDVTAEIAPFELLEKGLTTTISKMIASTPQTEN